MELKEYLAKEYWNQRYSNGGTSGYGSYGEQLESKIQWLSTLTGVRSIIEFGCGDFNFGRRVTSLFPDASYYGLDISNVIIRRNQQYYPQFLFRELDADTAFLKSDLVLCVDVLYHIQSAVESDRLLERLEECWQKYLVLTAYEYDGLQQNHIHIRKFNPDRFGNPILRKVVEADGQLFFYIFEK